MRLGVDVDLVDLRAADTVLQSEIITTGRRLFIKDGYVELFEVDVLLEKIDLDAARAPLIADILGRGGSMADDVLLHKVAVIERCVARAREEYAKDPATFASDFTRQDAATLNIQRACQGCLDAGFMLVRRHRLGAPRSGREVFALLTTAGVLDAGLGTRLQRMAGYRNIATHDYQSLQLPITVDVIEHHLDDFLDFGAVVLRDRPPPPDR